MKKVLFPFRIYDNNVNAFCYGATLARRQNAQFVLLNTFKVEEDDITQAKLDKIKRQHWVEAFDEIYGLKGFFVKKYAQNQGDLTIKYDYRILTGDFNYQIIELCKEEAFELVVLNWPKHNSEFNDDLRKLAKRLLEIGASVLFVPEEADLKNIHHLALATDLRKIQNGKMLIDQFVKLAHLFDASAQFIYVSDDGSLEDVEDQNTLNHIRKLNHCSERYEFTVLKGVDAVSEIKTYSKTNEIGLLVVVKKQRTFLNKLFHESFTGRLVHLMNCPVLITQDDKPLEVGGKRFKIEAGCN